ncbi:MULTISPECIES: cytochrome c biogenesis protein CcsA [Dyadobacter]|jgi:heme exporter protein C|uniref:Cytochrome c biogenesis protein n=1 Tax=Dyadobacter chenhuakuii TaxID=2909339 RepID=A0A9X1QA54_9BACT|nr:MULTISPECIES: cytochrome c biogenesis protein CcsA [Dyadobacter]MCE7069951.1 cytochrome c biogenesis protein [Dyadobacter sp. CY327]MCF2497294.1 cytochrome c biogenesis protein [Dyadobacter chenhuakuii]
MRKIWWKILCIVIIFYVIVMGLMGPVPHLAIINESIRNTYFHVALWLAMTTLLFVSMIFSIRYLNKGRIGDDDIASELAKSAIFFGILGCLTGSVWANYTWGDPWPNDPKLNGAAVGILIYLAYLLLRSSFEDEQRKARISSVYNIFAFAVFIPIIYILPRLTDSLHPGSGGNSTFGSYDFNSDIRKVFYPAIIGYILLGLWLAELRIRIKVINRVRDEALITSDKIA